MWANTCHILQKREILPRTLGNKKFNSRALRTPRLFTIYTEKLFSQRFVQVVMKKSLIMSVKRSDCPFTPVIKRNEFDPIIIARWRWRIANDKRIFTQKFDTTLWAKPGSFIRWQIVFDGFKRLSRYWQFKGNLHSWSKRTFNCRKYSRISNYGWKPSHEVSVLGETGFVYRLYLLLNFPSSYGV